MAHFPDAKNRAGRQALEDCVKAWGFLRKSGVATLPHWMAAWLVAAAIVCTAGVTSNAQVVPGIQAPAEAEAEADPISVAEVARRLADLRGEIASIDEALPRAAAEPAAHLRAVRAKLEKIEHALEEQSLLPSPTEAASPVAPEATPSLFELNALYEARSAMEAAAEEAGSRVAISRDELEAAKEALDAIGKERREVRGALDAAGPSERTVLERKLELLRLEERLAQEVVYLRTLETRSLVARRDDESGIANLNARIDAMRAALERGEGAPENGFARLAVREDELRRKHEDVERRVGSAELRLEAAQNRFARQAQAAPELLQEVEALTAHRDALRQQAALIDAQRERLVSERELWQHWEAMLRGVRESAQLATWEEHATKHHEALGQAKLRATGRISDVESRLENLQRRLDGGVDDPRLSAVLEGQAHSLRELRDALRDDARATGADWRLSQRVLAEIHERTGHLDPLEQLARGAEALGDVWNYEIATVDDSPITVGAVVLALVLFVAGLWAARRGSAIVERVAERRLRLDAGAAHALGTLSFYALLLSFSLLALRAVHFPLTAFTVLGGALAIGIGFGSQNVMNNFISGLILMLERPVRARDVVEVDGNFGTIENIGARSTQIRSTDGRHIIVPNSFFLENNVVNWTLSDDLMRAKVSVGVIYGSPTRLVEKRIRQVVDENDQILKSPAPIIIFEEFGDNSLNFDVYFWVKARSPMAMRKIQSHVRFGIDDLFREDNLVIAFPQRDVHLDSASPIEVRIVNESKDAKLRDEP